MELLEWMENKNSDDTSDGAYRITPLMRRIVAAAVCAVLILIAFIYTAKSRTIYFWDDATYWDISRSVLSGALKGGFWHKVYESIGTSDYNYVAALPSALWMRIFGISRISYVMGLTIMYIIPSAALLYRLAARLSKAPMLAYMAAIFIIPSLIFIAASGFADVGALPMMLGCYALYYPSKPERGASTRYIWIGVLLVFMMVYRRYFAFFSVSFITAMAMDCMLFGRKKRNFFITVLTAALMLFTVFKPFLTGILIKDYGTLYSDYKYSIYTDFKLITRYFGSIFLITAAAVPFVSMTRRKDARPIFMWIQIIVCAAMFMATQTHGIQHLLLYIPSLSLLTMLFINCIRRQNGLIALALLVAVNFVSPFIPRTQPTNIQDIKGLAFTPTFSMLPEKRDDTGDILRIKRKLDKVIPEWETCSVLASSFVINDSILRNVEPSLNVNINRDGDYIIALPCVDSRDYGRLEEIYTAQYILVATPAQTHLADGSQTIITEAVSSFVNYTDIATSFFEVYSFEDKIGDISVKLFQRVEEVNAVQKRDYENRLYK